MAAWQTLSSKIVYENPWMIVHEDETINPAGAKTMYGYVESKSASVYVVPIDENGDTYIVKQHRYAIKRDTWECVAGRTDGEATIVAAKRELLEETGLEANDIHVIGEIQTANGMTTFKSTVCIARKLKKVTDQLDQTDGIMAAEKVSLSRVRKMILAGDIKCSQSIAVFLMATAYLEEQAV